MNSTIEADMLALILCLSASSLLLDMNAARSKFKLRTMYILT